MWQGKPNCVCGGQLDWLKMHSNHMIRIKSAKSVLNIKKPFTFNYVTHSAKIDSLKKNSEMKIRKENMILLGKILRIDMSQTKNYGRQEPFHTKSNSLNINFRRKTERKISNENAQLLSRLTNVKPVYKKCIWERDHLRHLIMSKNIGHQSSIFCCLNHPLNKDEGRAQQISFMILNKSRPRSVSVGFRTFKRNTMTPRSYQTNTNEINLSKNGIEKLKRPKSVADYRKITESPIFSTKNIPLF